MSDCTMSQVASVLAQIGAANGMKAAGIEALSISAILNRKTAMRARERVSMVRRKCSLSQMTMLQPSGEGAISICTETKMAKYRNDLPQLKDKVFLTDGGLETTLVFHD